MRPLETRAAQRRRWRQVLIAYITMKQEQEDWHGVADAAMDLRELDAELRATTDDDDPRQPKE